MGFLKDNHHLSSQLVSASSTHNDIIHSLRAEITSLEKQLSEGNDSRERGKIYVYILYCNKCRLYI